VAYFCLRLKQALRSLNRDFESVFLIVVELYHMILFLAGFPKKNFSVF
jgi:hypothetical protein